MSQQFTSNRKLVLDDILDLRAYERERPDFRAHVIALKKKRRIHLGPILTFVFENRDTIRFQIQEMARVERIITDEGIETELDVYNPLIPEPGHLCATLFVELTTEAELREWLPKLVGVETMIELRLGRHGEATEVIPCEVDPEHAKQLTREEVTASVHYVTFELGAAQVERFGTDPVRLAVTHPEYQHEVDLGSDTVRELLTDLQG